MKEREVKYVIRSVLSDEERTHQIFDLVKKQDEY